MRMGCVMVSFCALLLGGCGLADAIRELKSLSELGVDDGASEGVSMSLEVTPDKDAVLELPTGAKLAVPKGAVDGAVTLSIARPKDAEALQFVKTVSSTDKVSSAPYVLTPHGTQFKKGVEVTLPVAKDRTSEKLVVAWLKDENDKEWKTLGKPKVKDGVATIEVDHFSVLVLLERDSAANGAPSVMPGEDLEPDTLEPVDDGFGNSLGGDPRGDAGPGAVDTGGFRGDSDLIGTWDVTIEEEGKTPDNCTAEILEDLSFTVTCDDGPSNYGVDCDYDINLALVSGTIDVGTGSIQGFQMEQFTGVGCASYDLSVGQLSSSQELDAELTQIEAGLGKLGGKWTASFFDWGCPGGGPCEPAERTRSEEAPVPCDFELADTGAVHVTCTDGPHEEGGGYDVDGGVVEGSVLDCKTENTIEGALGNGVLQLRLSSVDVGTECDASEGAVIKLRGERR